MILYMIFFDDFMDADINDEVYEDVTPKKSNKKKNLLDEIRNMSDDSSSSSFLPSSYLPKESTMSKEEKLQKEYDDSDKWFDEMFASYTPKINKYARLQKDLFKNIGKKKKKHKGEDSEDDEQLVDYRKEFEPEMNLYKNLMVEQNNFTASLQKEYDAIKSRKSSARGVTKQITDLIENINDARTLSMQLIEKQVNAKKLISELTLKQNKDKKDNKAVDNTDISNFGSNYIKKILNERNQILSNEGTGEASIGVYTDDEIFDQLNTSLADEERPEEVDKYLQYENRNVEIYVAIEDNDIENYQFIARDEDGQVIDDFPLPEHTNISVNRSTNIATDQFGQKYKIEWH